MSGVESVMSSEKGGVQENDKWLELTATSCVDGASRRPVI